MKRSSTLHISREHRPFLHDVRSGLSAPQKSLPCKYFYDQRGSQLFDQICQLEEYYLTRAELDIMEQHADEMGQQIGAGVMLVEYGSGSSVKTRYLLDALPEAVAYVPVDISEAHLRHTAAELAADYPAIEVLPLCADFTSPVALPRSYAPASHVAVYFPGSTIGNFQPTAAQQLLRQIAGTCGPGGGLLIGIDLRKDPARITAAYNDARGVTAAFNLNLLARINRELHADFDLNSFAHRAVYNEELGRVEIDLVSRKRQSVHIAGQTYVFLPGEAIRTEYSHKYSLEEFAALAVQVGLVLHHHWTDRRHDFAVLHLVVE